MALKDCSGCVIYSYVYGSDSGSGCSNCITVSVAVTKAVALVISVYSNSITVIVALGETVIVRLGMGLVMSVVLAVVMAVAKGLAFIRVTVAITDSSGSGIGSEL